MATINLKFRPSAVPKAEGTLYYQVIHKRNVKRISTEYHIFPHEWDRKTLSLSIPHDGKRRTYLQQMQSTINRELKRRKEIVYKLESSDKDFSLDELCDAFRQIPSGKSVFPFLQEQIARQKRMQRHGTAMTYTSAYRRFKEFRGGRNLTFSELSPNMIEEYEAWLVNRGLMQNTIRFYLRTLNTLLYKAVDEGLLNEAGRVFSRVRLSYVKTAKRAITERHIHAIQTLQLPKGSALAFARDIFMFSFYMRGMPFVDIAFLKKSDLKNGLVNYCRKKTNQPLTVEWEREQQEIIDRYARLSEGTPYMLPIITKTDGTEYRQYLRVQGNVNRALKKIGNMIGLKMPLTFYVARHSWASIAQEMNYSIAIISEGMGHNSIKTTQTYLASIDTSKVNEANRNIIRRISKKE